MCRHCSSNTQVSNEISSLIDYIPRTFAEFKGHIVNRSRLQREFSLTWAILFATSSSKSSRKAHYETTDKPNGIRILFAVPITTLCQPGSSTIL